MREIDVLGKACPIPVIETKKALRENPDEKEFEILVDNEVATENLRKKIQSYFRKNWPIKRSQRNWRLFCKSSYKRKLCSNSKFR